MLKSLLHSFDKISLKEMGRVSLMNRTESKYCFHHNLLPTILEELKFSYSVLLINAKSQSNYKTLYYDTDDFSMYQRHHSGKLNRHKVRHRFYVDSKTAFLEVKFKNNKGRSIKQRIKKNELSQSWLEEDQHFLAAHSPYTPDSLLPAVWVNYSRITLVHKLRNERLTIDLNLNFKKGDYEKDLKNMVIAEIKQEKDQASDFSELMKKLYIRKGSMSKYCLALIYTTKQVKSNNFKAKLIQLEKIIKHDSLTNSR